MSGKAKIKKEFQSFDSDIEKMVTNEIGQIKEQLNQIRVKAEKTGEEMERKINETQTKDARKKR